MPLTEAEEMLTMLMTWFGSTALPFSQSNSLKANTKQTLVANFSCWSHPHPLHQPPVRCLGRHLYSICQPPSLHMQNRGPPLHVAEAQLSESEFIWGCLSAFLARSEMFCWAWENRGIFCFARHVSKLKTTCVNYMRCTVSTICKPIRKITERCFISLLVVNHSV